MLSVIIVTWNTREQLRNCLSSIDKFPPNSEFEVIVVDNASNDGTFEMVQSEFPAVHLHASGSNIGYAAGNNLGFNRAGGEFLLTLNPDTEFEDDSLETSYQELIKRPECGVLGLQLIGPDKIIQKSVRGFPTILGVFGAMTGLDRLFPDGPLGSYSLPRFDYLAEGPADQPMGTFLMFRRSALETVGDPKRPFDEEFPIFFNEVDLLYRLKISGQPCWYTPKAHVLHQHGASTRQVRKSMIWESHRSLVRYFRKHLRGGARLAIPFIAVAASLAAFMRARGWHAGFVTHRHDM